MQGRCPWVTQDAQYITYHDTQWGRPVNDSRELFEKLCLDGQQAGLSWITILKRTEGYRRAFAEFDPQRIAAFGPQDVERLLQDTGIIRNRLKVAAAIHNAGVIRSLRRSHGGFAAWLDAHHPLDKAGWVALFKRSFRFTGGEITGEFLMSLGYLPGAHRPDCPVQARIAALSPPWMRAAGA